jgi:predicted SAM-dependent methyltransferase
VATVWSEEHDGESREVNFVIGFCMAFRKSLFDEIGSFDETHWPCCGEEIDFCFRARTAGYKIGIAVDVYVHHIGSQTFKIMETDGKVEYGHVCRRNDMHLEKKWGPNIWGRQTGPLNGPVEEKRHNGAIRLNLGCGPYTLAGFINIDQFEDIHPDLIADVRNLPYEPGTVDEIYCGHLLEHLTFEEGQKALRHWHSILKIGGKIMLTVPDFDYLVKTYLANPTADNMKKMNDLYIYSYTQKSHHRYCYGSSLLKATMAEAGFGDIEKVSQTHPYCTSAMEDQISFKGVK